MIFFTLTSYILIIIFACVGGFFSKKLSIRNSFFYNIIAGLLIYSIINLLINFFTSLHSMAYYLIVLLVVIFSLKEIKLIKYNDFLYSFILCLFSSLISYKMHPGYDAGLYHFPFQSWISSEKIAFGLNNLNHRFSITSIYSYWSAPLWIGTSPIMLITLQVSIYAIFFIYLFNLINTKFTVLKIFAFATIISFPLWNRYQVPTYGLADTAYGIFLFISIIFFIQNYLKIDSKEVIANNDLFNLLTLASLDVTLKPSGLLIIIFYLFGFFIFKKKITIENRILILPMIFLVLWYAKNIIISSCLNPILKFTCIKTQWYNAEYINMLEQQLLEWREKIFVNKDYFQDLLNIKLFVFILVFFFIIRLVKKYTNINNLSKIIKNNKTIIRLLLVIIYLLTITQFQKLEGYYQNLDIVGADFSKKIIKTEIINILTFNLVCLFALYFFFYKKIKLDSNYFYIILDKFPLIYLIFCFTLWLINVADPRLAYGYFALLLPLIIFTFNSQIIKYSNEDYKKSFILIIFSILNITNNLQIKNIFNVEYVPPPEVNYTVRKEYGNKPDLKKDNLCWMIKDCYYYERDIQKEKFFYNYYILKLKN